MTRRSTALRLALSLAIGAVGGFLFAWLRLPLAWMLGPMSFNMFASLGRLPVAVPGWLRNATFAVIGVFLGSAFSPEVLERARDWPWSLGAVLVFVALLTAASRYYYRRVAGYDGPTALFSATPGGLSTMVAVGVAAGGDERYIALTQALRVVIVVFLIPVLVTFLAASPDRATGIEPAVALDIRQALWLIVGACIGILCATLLRLPAPQMTGSLIASAALYLSAWVQAPLPQPLLFMALWILGCSVGARFAGTRWDDLLAIGRHALVSVTLMLIMAAVLAGVFSALLGHAYLAVLLAFAPGGVAEMCLIAVALDIDPTFVATHHLVRILFIVLIAPVLRHIAAIDNA